MSAPRPVLGHAFPLVQIETRVSGLMEEVVEHLIKIADYPEAQEVPHWTSEVFNWLRQIRHVVTRAKTPGGKVKEVTLLEWLLPFITEEDIRDERDGFGMLTLGPPLGDVTAEDLRRRFRAAVTPLLDTQVPLMIVLQIVTGKQS